MHRMCPERLLEDERLAVRVGQDRAHELRDQTREVLVLAQLLGAGRLGVDRQCGRGGAGRGARGCGGRIGSGDGHGGGGSGNARG